MKILLRRWFVNSVLALDLVPPGLRWRALVALGFNVRGARISAQVWFSGPGVKIGRNTFINREVFFDSSAPINLGSDCAVGMHTKFITSSHEVGTSVARAGRALRAPITVGDGCWIGAAAIVLPGVTIGRGAVIAAGSVVVNDVPPNTMHGGVPARLIRDFSKESD